MKDRLMGIPLKYWPKTKSEQLKADNDIQYSIARRAAVIGVRSAHCAGADMRSSGLGITAIEERISDAVMRAIVQIQREAPK